MESNLSHSIQSLKNEAGVFTDQIILNTDKIIDVQQGAT